MKELKRVYAFFLVLTLAAAALSALGQREAAHKAIRIGLMADFTGLPFLVAEKEGLFAAAGLPVVLSVFRSAVERDTALHAGVLDGCNADLIAALASRRAGYDVKIVASALNRFSLVASPAVAAGASGHGLGLADLSGASIGLSRNTVIEYVADSLIDPIVIKKIDIARIPIRLELLLRNQLDAAVLPLPFDALAVAGGGAIVADSLAAGLDPDLFIFYAAELEERPDSYAALWRTLDEARGLIEENPDRYRSLLSSRLGFDQTQAASMPFPAFPPYVPPSDEQIQLAAQWMVRVGLLTTTAVTENAVAKGLLP